METTSRSTESRDIERQMRIAYSQDVEIKLNPFSDMSAPQNAHLKEYLHIRKQIAQSYFNPALKDEDRSPLIEQFRVVQDNILQLIGFK